MARLIDVSLENLSDAPEEVLSAVFWELDVDIPEADARFQKEEWFSSTLLEWGTCGKLLVEDGRVSGFAEYGPAPFFPRLGRYRCGRVSADAVYLSYCYVVGGRRGRGLGTLLVRAVARDLVDRGFRAIEALGDRHGGDGWVIPAAFLAANRFGVVREDRRFPLMRLDLREATAPATTSATTAVPLPE